MDILDELNFPGKLGILENDTFEALPMQSCIAKVYIGSIGAAGSRRTFPHFFSTFLGRPTIFTHYRCTISSAAQYLV